jgi:uncharacterized membrane protein
MASHLQGLLASSAVAPGLAPPGAAVELLPEDTVRSAVDTLVRLVEAAGALVIFLGAVIAVVTFVRALPRRDPQAFVPVRLSLGRYLALGLEFQLASDVLRTAVAPSFAELGKLAAVAAIRTALNFFLAREINEERRIVDERREGGTAPQLEGNPATHAGSPEHLHGTHLHGTHLDGTHLDGTHLDGTHLNGRPSRASGASAVEEAR